MIKHALTGWTARMRNESAEAAARVGSPTSALTRWIGIEGRAFERVCVTFEALGFVRPSDDPQHPEPGRGMYIQQLVDGYRSDLSQSDVIAVVDFALSQSLATLQAWKRDKDTKDALRMSDVTGGRDDVEI